MKDMKWYNVLQLSAMLLMAAAMPIDWRVGLWSATLLGVVSVVKIVAERRLGNPNLSARQRWPLFAILVYWGYLLVSVLWSADKATAFELLWLKFSMLPFALVMLLSDTSYVKTRHLPWFGYSLVAGLVGKFIYCCVQAVIKIVGGKTLESIIMFSFDPMHHAYIALYIVVALVFIYWVLSAQWAAMPRRLRTLFLVIVPLMLLYDIIVNSRAGIMMMYFSIVACMLHLALYYRRWRTALSAGLLLLAFCVLTEAFLPGHEMRVVNTIRQTATGEVEDTRITITRYTTEAFKDKPLTGYGAGDYREHLVDTYSDNDFTDAADHRLNAHNQYLESLLSSGIFGLVSLIAMLAMPLLVAFLQRSRYFWLIAILTVIVAANFLFESMLERQMGLLFIGFLIAVMVLILSAEENNFAQIRKS